MTYRRAVELMLMAVACELLAMIAWAKNPGDPWARIGLALVPVLLGVLLVAVAAEWRSDV